MLREKLLSRLISTGFGKRTSLYNVPLNVEQARGTRDALSKVYTIDRQSHHYRLFIVACLTGLCRFEFD